MRAYVLWDPAARRGAVCSLTGWDSLRALLLLLLHGLLLHGLLPANFANLANLANFASLAVPTMCGFRLVVRLLYVLHPLGRHWPGPLLCVQRGFDSSRRRRDGVSALECVHGSVDQRQPRGHLLDRLHVVGTQRQLCR